MFHAEDTFDRPISFCPSVI